MFSNTVLIIMFNHISNINNKEYLRALYSKYFKTIIFYSDIQANEKQTDTEINYLDTHNGWFAYKIFKHFSLKYKNLLNESDGLFYTMDDNIINVNILNLYSNKKIIYYKPYNNKKTNEWFDCKLETIDKCGYHSSNWWTRDAGKKAIYNMLKDEEFLKYDINKYSAKFSDFFYLPKKYLIDKLFNLFELFSKYNVFLEIAVPSVIHNMEYDETQYHNFDDDINWQRLKDRSCPKFNNFDNIYNSFNKEFNLFLHPIKFNLNYDTKEWLVDIFMKKKCVIITTINEPTQTILEHLNNNEYDLIIVGDKKTPNSYKNYKCIFLDISSQEKLFPKIKDILPYNHYCRKNLGYLFSIKKDYKVIYETDDDNVPLKNFDNILNYTSNIKLIKESNMEWINIFNYFKDCNKKIWPRGYPISLIETPSNFSIKKTQNNPAILCGLVENDPDVDALYRLTQNNNITWKTDENVVISNNNICVFNTQNTFWINNAIYLFMYLPSSVSFRYCDILRGIICNIILKKTNTNLQYFSPNVIQYRNEHNLISDLKSELEMYIHNENILNIIKEDLKDKETPIDILKQIYKNLFKNNIITKNEIDILNFWIEYFN